MMALADDTRQRDFEVLQVDDLDVDHRYQRALDQRLVERILADWDPVAADVITVSRRKNGKLFIVNGQHRAAAAKLAGEKEICAFVHEGMNVKQEADLRLKANNNRPDTALERFHAQITKGVPETLKIVEIVESFGSAVNRSPTKYSGINCVSTLEQLYRDDEQRFRATLRALQEAHGEIAGSVATTEVLRGVFWFLKVHDGEYNWRELITRMEKTGYDELHRRAQSHKTVARGSDWLNYYRALVEAYNWRRSEKNRLELKTTYSSKFDQNKRFPPDR